MGNFKLEISKKTDRTLEVKKTQVIESTYEISLSELIRDRDSVQKAISDTSEQYSVSMEKLTAQLNELNQKIEEARELGLKEDQAQEK